MIVNTAFLIATFILCVCAVYDICKKEKVHRKLNRIYEEREAREERRRRLIAEKPDYVIFQSELVDFDGTFKYIGRLDELPKRGVENLSIANMNGWVYLFKDGKWYEIVDDMPRL